MTSLIRCVVVLAFAALLLNGCSQGEPPAGAPAQETAPAAEAAKSPEGAAAQEAVEQSPDLPAEPSAPNE